MNQFKIFIRKKITLCLIGLFIIGLFLRFLYFPDNTYFGYDQARDAFISKELLGGHIKIVGPTTSIPGLNHGALFYYIFAPVYLISQGNPQGLSIFLRIYNALGIFLIFLIGKNLFNKKAGLISALLFAFSYEQTQYALFMTHPALAVLSVLTFYLGLSFLLFKGKAYGLPLALLGLGLSFQFHFLLAYLWLVFILNLGFFWKRIPKINLKIILISIFSLAFSLSTFILTEVKFGFKGIYNLVDTYSKYPRETGSAYGGVDEILFAAKRYASDNIFFTGNTSALLLLILLLVSLYYLKEKDIRDKVIFLLIWFIVGLFSYLMNKTSLYFYGIGTSLSLLILVSFLTGKIYSKSKIIAVTLILIILSSNFYLILKNNPRGPNPEINVQTGMFLENQKQAMDYIYQKANGQPFAVNAFTMPLFINTTWAYLFQWYGQKKYGYLPVWGGRSAAGYPGNLEINNSRTTLPNKRFLIVEPVRGIERMLKDFIIEEGYFTDTIEEKQFGDFKVRFQKPK